MTARVDNSAWDSVPLNPERGGWHWIVLPDRPMPYFWVAAGEYERARWVYGADKYEPEGGTYLGPCLTPSEHAALIAERDAGLARERLAGDWLAETIEAHDDARAERDAAAEQRDDLLASMQAAIGAVEIERDAAVAEVEKARRDAREACAEILDNFVCDLNKGKLIPVRNDMPDVVRGAYAAAIRARSQENNNDT